MKRRIAAGLVGIALALPSLAWAQTALEVFETKIKPQMPPGVVAIGTSSALGATGFLLERVVVTPPPKDGKTTPPITIDRIAVETVDVDALKKDIPPGFMRLKISGINLVDGAIPDVDLKPVTGGATAILDVLLDYRTDVANKVFDLTRVEVDARGMVRAEVSAIFDKVDFSDPAKGPDLDKAELRVGNLVLTDSGLLEKGIRAVAAEQKMDPEQMVGIWAGLLEGFVAAEAADVKASAAALGQFLKDWKKTQGPLRVAIAPAQALPLGNLGSKSAPADTARSAGISVTYAGLAAPAATATSRAPSVAGGQLCQPNGRVFYFLDGTWNPATVREATSSGERCVVRPEGADKDEIVGSKDLTGWSIDGPGQAVTACTPGLKVVAYSDDEWYPAEILREQGAGRCRVHFIDYGSDKDEPVAIKQIRTRP